MSTDTARETDLFAQVGLAERAGTEGTAVLILACWARSGRALLDTEVLSPLHICLLRVARGCRADLVEQTFGVRLVGQPDPVLGLRVEQVAPALAFARSSGWVASGHGHYLRITEAGRDRVDAALDSMPESIALAIRDAANDWRRRR